MNIFIVEDDYKLNKILTINLKALGYNVSTFTDGQEAFENINMYDNVYLIDINLPSINGLELIKQIKILNKYAKIFIISGDTNINTILNAYNLGCDDYIKKPFDIREIIVKINHALLKSSRTIQLSASCNYNPISEVVNYKNNELRLTKKETLLLIILVKNVGYTVSNEKIENYVWGETVGNGYTRQLISKLRKTLPCKIIKNHTANGYRIDKYYQH